MNKLVWGVGVNDLGYRTQVYEYVTENGGKRVLKPVFRCSYHTTWRDMLGRCYSKKIPGKKPKLYWHERLQRVVVRFSIQKMDGTARLAWQVSRQRHYCAEKQTVLP